MNLGFLFVEEAAAVQVQVVVFILQGDVIFQVPASDLAIHGLHTVREQFLYFHDLLFLVVDQLDTLPISHRNQGVVA